MLIVAKITKGTAGGYAEYLEGKARSSELGDYYVKDGERVEAPGRWAGGAHLFGADSSVPVTGEQLRTLMDVRPPDTGGELRRVGGSGEVVAALDATFSTPKSVSAVWALGSPELRERIEASHEIAIDRALDHAVRHVPMLRRRVDANTSCMTRPSGWSRRAGGIRRPALWPIRSRTRSCTRTSCCTPRSAASGGANWTSAPRAARSRSLWLSAGSWRAASATSSSQRTRVTCSSTGSGIRPRALHPPHAQRIACARGVTP